MVAARPPIDLPPMNTGPDGSSASTERSSSSNTGMRDGGFLVPERRRAAM
jgi:hypothetical protein